ncbi:PepSY-associated TM helix domain-containing protein [Fodinibius sediminis]|uniref:Uncharacterized iron-regulated membrane protein n=1 Tax=Fodinibius sediminis TaxID=1214077 RepID=A0A521C7Z9_9BACT|nr:PepSY-associated TM helix domain-containing protein [Fodinibius sediminis]SMO54931.1 Uncharacterized iron-regulated membrane protein [Fodinibius sediminis]
MTSFKDVVLLLHRWVGLITGLVVLTLSITGCLFVFQEEISTWLHEDIYFADEIPAGRQTLPIDQLQENAADALNVDHLPFGITTHKDPGRNWSAMLYKGGLDSWTYFGSMEVYKTAYINPYNGEVEGIINEKNDFFQVVKGIHWSLLLATPVGQPIIVWSTVLFIILLISGIILWWPKRWNRIGKKKSFKIKWGSTWRRINYDLHNVLGFYFLAISLIIAFTGLYWYFPFVQKSLHFLGSGTYNLPPVSSQKVVSSVPEDGKALSALNKAYSRTWREYPEAYSITFTAPTDSQGTIQATVRPDGQTYYNRSTLQFDQYSGSLLAANSYQEKDSGEKLVAMNYDIHVGAIGGLPGKIIAFFASLVCGSLPVTGFIIWWDRRKRSRSRERRVGERRKQPATPEEGVPA